MINKQKTAIISGITGQDGSYLAELLLEKGYKVIGIKRRTSLLNAHERLDSFYNNKNLELVYGNMHDASSIFSIINKYKPDEFYNLAAQSHVKVSFEVTEETLDTVAKSTLRILNAIKELSPHTRFYQASSSEMYGTAPCPTTGYTEDSIMLPASPYAAAKLFGHNIVKNYRNSYGLHASSGILFNHETLGGFMPLVFKTSETTNLIDIKPISEIVKYHTKNENIPSINEDLEKYQETNVDTDLYVWDKEKWTKVLYASGYPHLIKEDNKRPKFIISKKSAVFATGNHHHIMDDGTEKEFSNIKIGDKVSLVKSFPDIDESKNLTIEEANLIGFIVGDGYCKKQKNKNNYNLKLISKNKEELEKYKKIWDSLNKTSNYYHGKSGFNPLQKIWHLTLNQSTQWVEEKIPDLYTETNYKRIPKIILNSNKNIMQAFLEGYNDADGLKKNNCIYEFKNFKTNSATLALGLLFLIEKTTKQKCNINVEHVFKFNKWNLYYSINLLSNTNRSLENSKTKYELVKRLLDNKTSIRKINRDTKISRKTIQKIKKGYIPSGKHHFAKNENEVKKIIEIPNYNGWFYDLTTESGTFHAGIGNGHVHNSPRRGETFVSRKISIAAARIKTGVQDKLYLGNLDACRDWGYADDYVYGMYLMLQQEKPDDYVLATGETHTVREFLEETFKLAGLDIDKCVEIDSRLFRPEEVPYLLGDASKANKAIGWLPKVKFKELVEVMYEHEIENILK